jgi:hypothetical protein
MKASVMSRIVVSLLLLAPAHAEQTKVTPIQKVLTLMEEMKAKGISAKNEEETKFSFFAVVRQHQEGEDRRN